MLQRPEIAVVKHLTLTVLVVAALCAPAAAQVVENPVTVLKFSWEKVRIRPPSVSSLVSREELIEQQSRQQQLAMARNKNDKGEIGRVQSQISKHEQAKAQAQEPELPRDGYRYKVRLKNNGPLTITSIDWDYIFLDGLTQREMARHEFTSDEKVRPGASKEISVLYGRPPTMAVPAQTSPNTKKEGAFEQRVEIARIQFADGSVWQRP